MAKTFLCVFLHAYIIINCNTWTQNLTENLNSTVKNHRQLKNSRKNHRRYPKKENLDENKRHHAVVDKNLFREKLQLSDFEKKLKESGLKLDFFRMTDFRDFQKKWP